MAGKFTNTSYTDKINNLTDNIKKLLNNPYYLWQDKKGTVVTYYSLDKKLSTLDEGAKIQYDNRGSNSPFWFKKIYNFLLYGMDRIQLNIDLTDFGPDSGDIGGSAVVLPNTIEPCPGDYFVINHLNKDYVFKVKDVQPDTMENGANLYQIDYDLEYNSSDVIDTYNVSSEHQFLVNNVGTALSPIVTNENFNYIQFFEDIITKIQEYYKTLFVSNRVQTIIFSNKGYRFYDPYMLEFIKQNGLLEGGDHYYYLQHMIDPGKMFPIIYSKTFYKALMEKDKVKMSRAILSTWGLYIESDTSIFASRYEDYYRMVYEPTPNVSPTLTQQTIDMFDVDLIQHVTDNVLYDDDILYNIIIKYMNDTKIEKEDLKYIDDIDYIDCSKLFYTIPCVLYCLEKSIQNHMC